MEKVNVKYHKSRNTDAKQTVEGSMLEAELFFFFSSSFPFSYLFIYFLKQELLDYLCMPTEMTLEGERG